MTAPGPTPIIVDSRNCPDFAALASITNTIEPDADWPAILTDALAFEKQRRTGTRVIDGEIVPNRLNGAEITARLIFAVVVLVFAGFIYVSTAA